MPPWLRKAGVALVILLLVGGIAFYIYYDRHARYFEETNDALIEADQVAISSRLAGYVGKVAVEDNQRVAKGALLVTIDPVDYRNRLDAADADIAAARAAEGAARASQAETLAAVEQARAGLKSAEADFAFATREVARYRPLVAKGAEPAAKLSDLMAGRDRADAAVAAQQAALRQAQLRVESAAAQATNLAAQVATATVRRRIAAVDLASTELAAPIKGKVASRSVRVGQYVQPGMRLLTLVPTDDLYVVANFKETQVGLMRPGQPASIRVDALPGVVFAGQVASVSPGTGANFSLIKPENATGNFTKIVQRVPVRIRISVGPIARQVLVPGMSLGVEVDTRAAQDEIDAIREEQERAGK